MKSIDELEKRLINIEKKMKIYKEKINDVFFYKLIRVNLFVMITEMLKLSQEKQKQEKLFKVVKEFFKTYLKEFFKKDEKYIENILFDNNRFYLENKEYKSIHLEELVNKLDKQNKSYGIIYPWGVEDFKKKKKAIKVSLKLFLGYSFNTFKELLKKKIKFNKLRKNNLVEQLKKNLRKEFGIDIPIEYLIEKEIGKFKLNYNYYHNYFKKKKVKKIYLICSYGKEGIIAAAKDLKIEVIELQHGIIIKQHLGYNFKEIEIPYFPDKLLLWGEYWKELNIFPKNTEIEISNFSYLNKQIEKYKNINRIEEQIIFISQGPIGRKLSIKAIEFAKENPEKKIVYKLHPREYGIWRKEYKELFKNKDLKNLIIVDNNKKNLYEYLYESSYLIGVSSTVIYEALNIGLKVGIIKLYSYEFFKEFENSNDIYFFNEEEKIDIEKIEKTERSKKLFFN